MLNLPERPALVSGLRSIGFKVLAGFLLAALITIWMNFRPLSRWKDQDRQYYFTARTTSLEAGDEAGDREPSVSQPFTIRISEGVHGFVIAPMIEKGPVTLENPRLMDEQGRVVHTYTSEQIILLPAGTVEQASDGGIKLKVMPGAKLRFELPFLAILSEERWIGSHWFLLQLGLLTAVFTGLYFVGERAFVSWRASASVRWDRVRLWCTSHVNTTLFLFSMGAVLLACHPVVFFDRSFASPNNGPACLYAGWPTLPGTTEAQVESNEGSDVAALMWAMIPYSVIQHRAIFEEGDLPLRNRYSNCGVGMLGQGVSMFGDPLHAIPIYAKGAAWAWDIKFLIARTLFAWGVGLLVWSGTRHLGVSALISVSASFVGFFTFWFTHPIFFSMCYAPWVLLAWVRGVDASTGRAALPWMLLLVFASLAEFASGAIKEAVVLLVFLNLVGLLTALFRQDIALRQRWTRAGRMLWAGVLFILLTTPFWLVFLDQLKSAVTLYDRAPVYQIQPGLFLGLFDDIFFRQNQVNEAHIDPSANFLILVGVIWGVVRWRKLKLQPLYKASVIVAVPLLAIIFGVVPPSWIQGLPFIGRILHISSTFSCPLLILGVLLAGFGLKDCIEGGGEQDWSTCWKRYLIILALCFAAYFGFTQAIHGRGVLVSDINNVVPKSAFFQGYAFVLSVVVIFLPYLLRRQALGRLGPAGWLLLSCGMIALHFRFAMFLETKFDFYAVNPQARLDIHEPSPAIESIRKRMGEPARVMGFGEVLCTNFNAIYDMECIGGPDPLMNKWVRELMNEIQFRLAWEWRVQVKQYDFPAIQPYLDMFNVRFYLATVGEWKEPVPGLRILGQSDLEVLQSDTAWPRAFFTDELGRHGTLADLKKKIELGDGRPFASQHEEGFSGGPPDPTRRVVPATGYQLTTNSTAFQLEAPSPGVAVLMEAFEEGNFRLTINGKPAEYTRVNHAFLAVKLPEKGRYEVRFEYWPRHLTLALCMAGAGVLALLGSVLLLFLGGGSDRLG